VATVLFDVPQEGLLYVECGLNLVVDQVLSLTVSKEGSG
jgi:hypothetical protein